MDSFFFGIKNQIYETAVLVVAFFKQVNPLLGIGGLVALYIFIFRKWAFSKVVSFVLTVSVLLLVYIRLDHFLLATLSQEAANFTVGIFRTLSVIVAGAILLYYSAVKQ